MSRLKTLVRNEAGTPPLRGGHSLCQGCGIPMVVRTVLDSIETPVVVVSATGCLEVATTRFPTTAWNVPWVHVAFENAAAVASGVEAAYRALRQARRAAAGRAADVRRLRRRRRHLRHRPAGALRRARARPPLHLRLLRQRGVHEHRRPAFRRDAVRREHDDEPGGTASFGKAQQRKDMTAIAVAHHVPYVAQAAPSHWHDLSEKVERAAAADGPAFLNVLTNCPRRLGARAAARARARERRGRDLLLAAVRGRRRPLPADLRARPASSRSRSGCVRRRASRTCSRPEDDETLAEIQRRVDDDWGLLERCGAR